MPGQIVTSIAHLSENTRLSYQQVRTSLNRLKSTGEITSKTTNKYTILTVRKWQDFQGEVTGKTTGYATNNQQTNNKQITTTKEVKNKRIKDIGEFVASLTPSEKLREAISDWIDMRIKNKKPPTEKAIELAYTKVRKMASTEDEAVAIFNQSTLNNWSGVFPIKE